MVGIVPKAEATFPPLGPVEVAVITGSLKRSGRRVVRIKGTHQTLTVAPGQVRDDGGESRLAGRLTDRSSQAGHFYGLEYFGQVILAATGQPIQVPVVALR